MKFNISCVFFLVMFSVASAQVKRPEPAPVKIPFTESQQAIVVATKDPKAVQGTAKRYERKSAKSKWKKVGSDFAVVVGRNGLGWSRDFLSTISTNDAPTLDPVFKALCSAWERKDEAGLWQFYSSETVKEFRQMMQEDNQRSLVEFLSDERLYKDSCKADNEQIFETSAIARIYSGAYPYGISVLFVRENGQWKLSNKGPDKFVPTVKIEGDGRAPAGLFPLTFAFGRPDKPGDVQLSYTKLENYSECVDDVSSSHYNKLVDRLKVGNFDWKSSEQMLEVGPEYDLGIFVAHNSFPVRPGDGSCIFLHVWKDSTTGTSGCTAMERDNLKRILAWADPAKNPYLVQLTEADLKKYRKAWNLPKL